MSASSKKKLRKEQNAAAMTQKQQAAAKEAKKMKIYTVTFWTVLVLCVALVAGLALQAPITGIAARLTTALEIGSHKVSAVELNYFYTDAINEYVNQYSSWISYLLDTSAPLSSQKYDSTTGKTWADQFLTMAIDNAKNTYALYDAAVAAGHSMSEDERKSIDSLYDNMDVYASYYGHSNVNDYLASVYGNGANEETYKEYYEVVAMASSYYSAYSAQLKDSYDDVALRSYEKDKMYEYNSYSYASHYLSVDSFKTGGTKGSDGKITYSEAEIKAAEEAAKKAAEELANADNNTVDLLNAAIEALEKRLEAEKEAAKNEENKTEAQTAETTDNVDDTTSNDTTDDTTDDTTGDDKEEDKESSKTYSKATEKDDTLYSSVSSLMQEWIRDSARKEGDITFLEYTTTSTDADGKETSTLKGYYVVLYKGVNDNTYALANVRHILVKFEGGTTNSTTGTTTYTEAEKNKAKEEAEKLYNEWLKGDKSEDSFSKLAKEKTDDSNGDQGGLYEDIVPGQMVTTFNDWCFDKDRKAGDHGIVVTEYGYHIMFYSSDSETNYRDYMVTNDLLTEDMEKWQKGLNDAMSLTEKNTSFVNKDLILNSGY